MSDYAPTALGVTTPPRIGALFAGYGGLDLAVAEVFGGHMAWYSEVDKGALKILGHRFPDVPNVGDVTAVDWSQVEPIDILTGGSPCQDLSHAGRRAGMTEGTRSNLWVAMREAIAQLRPSTVVWENVRGAFSAAADSAVEPCAGCVGDGPGVHLRALGRVLGDLSDLGYDTGWHGLRAADVGAPHGRFRVFIVATDTECGGRNGRAPQPIRLPVSRVTTAGSGEGVGPIFRTPTSQLAINGGSQHPDKPRLLPTPIGGDARGSRQSTAPNPRADNDTLSDVVYKSSWGEYAFAIARWERTLEQPAPAPTKISSKGNPQLSPVFVEWLMGLPAGWVTNVPGITRNEALKALGNGVVPQQAAAALRTMLAWEVAA